MKSKQELRSLMKEKRKQLTEEEKADADIQIYNNLITNQYFIKAKCVFVYVSTEEEVDTIKIISHCLKMGKKVCVPRVISKELGMNALQITSFGDLISKGAFGIKEPSNKCYVIDPKEIDIVLLPGLAFDRNGGRLGYGGGFYDRYLKTIRVGVIKIALSYRLQIVSKVPMTSYDIRIDTLITD